MDREEKTMNIHEVNDNSVTYREINISLLLTRELPDLKRMLNRTSRDDPNYGNILEAINYKENELRKHEG